MTFSTNGAGYGASNASTGNLFEDLPSRSGGVTPAPVGEALALLGRQLPRDVRLGTSSWNFPGWLGLIYGAGSGVRRLHAEGLRAYAAWPLFRTVGLDRNFYRPYTVDELANFAAQVPEDFSFIVKAPRDVTDPYLRAPTGRPLRPNPNYLNVDRLKSTCFAPVEAGLGDKAGVQVLQFSPFPHEALRRPEDRERATDALVRFFDAVSEANTNGRLVAAEFRNYEFLTPRLYGAMRRAGIRPVIGLHPAMPSLMRQMTALRFYETGERVTDPRGDWPITGPLVVRWSLAAHRFYDTAKADWSPFNAIAAPDPVTRAALAGLIVRAHASGAPTFMAVNNKAEGCAPETVRSVAEAVVAMNDRRLERERRTELEAEARERRRAGIEASTEIDPESGANGLGAPSTDHQ